MPLSLRTKIIGGCVLALIAVRELGWLNIDLSQSHSQTSTTISRTGPKDSWPSAKLSDVTVWPSAFDYVPFYKSRTVRGEVLLPASAVPEQALIRCQFEVEQTVTGLCSGRQFRDKIRKHVVDAINKRKK